MNIWSHDSDADLAAAPYVLGILLALCFLAWVAKKIGWLA